MISSLVLGCVAWEGILFKFCLKENLSQQATLRCRATSKASA